MGPTFAARTQSSVASEARRRGRTQSEAIRQLTCTKCACIAFNNTNQHRTLQRARATRVSLSVWWWLYHDGLWQGGQGHSLTRPPHSCWLAPNGSRGGRTGVSQHTVGPRGRRAASYGPSRNAAGCCCTHRGASLLRPVVCCTDTLTLLLSRTRSQTSWTLQRRRTRPCTSGSLAWRFFSFVSHAIATPKATSKALRLL